MEWDIEEKNGNMKLMVHREGIGTPPESWSISIGEFEDWRQAREKEATLEKSGVNSYIADSGCAYSLFAGPFATFPEAWDMLNRIPGKNEKDIVPTGKRYGNSIFWAAIALKPSETNVSIVTAPQTGGYVLPISYMASKTEAKAAINGGFFAGRYPIGSLVSEGFPLSSSYGKRSAAAWNSSGNIVFTSGYFNVSIRHGHSEIPVSYINRISGTNSVAFFSRFWGTFANPIPKEAVELTVSNNQVKGKRNSSKSNHFVPQRGYLLIAKGNKRSLFDGINRDDPIELELTWQDPTLKNFTNLIQGGPLLLRNGKPVKGDEGLSAQISDIRHPRTIVGSNGNNVLWMVIDGRNSWHSSGLTLDETRKLLLDLGFKDALNLDGGGSSELWWKNRIINSLPNGSERRVPYCVVFK